MTNSKFSLATFAFLLASGAAFAQETTTPAKPAMELECPVAGTVPEADLSAACKAKLGMTTNEQPATGAATTTESVATEQPLDPSADTTASTTLTKTTTTDAATGEAAAASSLLASQFMGQTVWSASNENVGEINDLVLNKDLDTIVAVVGVGGFLGLGEKDVAIPIDKITASKDADNKLTLKIAATKQELEAAPAFDRTMIN